MKLRHGEHFGNYVGTMWRMLFVFALMPWMRKYRLNHNSLQTLNFKFAANRLWTGRLPASMRQKSSVPVGYKALTAVKKSLSGVNEDPLKMLQQQNEALQKELIRLETENEMMRCLLFQERDKHTTTISDDPPSDSCPPRLLKKSSFERNSSFHTM